MHSVLVRKPEGKRPLGRPRRRWDASLSVLVSVVRTMYLKCLYYVCVCTMSCLYYVYCVCTMFII